MKNRNFIDIAQAGEINVNIYKNNNTSIKYANYIFPRLYEIVRDYKLSFNVFTILSFPLLILT